MDARLLTSLPPSAFVLKHSEDNCLWWATGSSSALAPPPSACLNPCLSDMAERRFTGGCQSAVLLCFCFSDEPGSKLWNRFGKYMREMGHDCKLFLSVSVDPHSSHTGHTAIWHSAFHMWKRMGMRYVQTRLTTLHILLWVGSFCAWFESN